MEYNPDPRDVLLDEVLWAMNTLMDDRHPADLSRKREAWETVNRLHNHVMAWHRDRAKTTRTRLVPEQGGDLCQSPQREVMPSSGIGIRIFTKGA